MSLGLILRRNAGGDIAEEAVYHVAAKPELYSFVGIEVVVEGGSLVDLLDGLSGVPGEQTVDDSLGLKDRLCRPFAVGA